MVTSISATTVPLTNVKGANEIAASGPTIAKDPPDTPPQEPIDKLMLITYHILSDRIGANANVVKDSLKQKIDDIASCTELLNGLSKWNTPPFVFKDPVDPLDPINEDRVKKTEALYLNGISIPDSDYDAVKYDFANGPKPAYSALPIPEIADKDLPYANLVVGQLYRDVTVSPDPLGGPDIITKEDFVYPGPNNPGGPPESALDLKTQHGTDFSNSTPGDLVQDLDTGRYYRVSNAKTGVEVTGYPLQKFVQSPNSDVLANLNAQISQKINASSDLSKADSLEIQKLQGFLTTVTTMCADLISSTTTLMNGIATKL